MRSRPTPPKLETRSSLAKRVALPLAVYFAVTLGVPFLNGAAARAEFWKHAAEVIAVAAVLVMVRIAWGSVLHAARRMPGARHRGLCDVVFGQRRGNRI